MKKVLLGLFLILGVVSFSALEIDADKIQKKNFQITLQDEVVVTLEKSEKDYEKKHFLYIRKRK